jgi:membrane protein YqaA with SNARE-associated domain
MYISKYGSYVAFFCWLPLVGDPLAVALGLFRSNSLNVAVWMLLGKAIRYAVMAYSVVYGKEYI